MSATRLDFKVLWRSQRCGLMNGSWRRLTDVQKAFYRASMWYVQVRGRIVNSRVASMLSEIIERLKACAGDRILRAGQRRAEELLSTYSARGVFGWCPHLRAWLTEPGYIFYLGLHLHAR